MKTENERVFDFISKNIHSYDSIMPDPYLFQRPFAKISFENGTYLVILGKVKERLVATNKALMQARQYQTFTASEFAKFPVRVMDVTWLKNI